MRITAILCVRNEERHLDTTLTHLVSSDIQLAIIDHDSTDATSAIYAKYRKHIVYEAKLRYTGAFSLTEQLAAKAEAMRNISSDWFIHQDADEILQSPRKNENLRDGILRSAREGFNVINFDEFVFIPGGIEDKFAYQDFYQEMLLYYFFEPKPRRLMRAWKNEPGTAQAGGGHRLRVSDLSLCPENFILRHYICLSAEHMRSKYASRVYAKEDLDKGWHGKRLNIDFERISLPGNEQLKHLRYADDKMFDKSNPWRKHFWETTSS
ncbi:MAG: glycosyltransferase family 2 protein [Gammaproteobacteria bacterium]